MGHESPVKADGPDSVTAGLNVRITVSGDCGRIHASFEDWQRCQVCERVLQNNLFLGRMLTATESQTPRDPNGR